MKEYTDKEYLQIEAEEIRAAAAFERRTINQWCRIALSKMASDVNKLPKEADNG